MVGDPDQAIYDFRGATPSIMTSRVFNDFFGCSTELNLSNNYRSLPAVLKAAEAVLSHGGTPRGHKPLVAMRAGGSGHVEHVSSSISAFKPRQ